MHLFNLNYLYINKELKSNSKNNQNKISYQNSMIMINKNKNKFIKVLQIVKDMMNNMRRRKKNNNNTSNRRNVKNIGINIIQVQ